MASGLQFAAFLAKNVRKCTRLCVRNELKRLPANGRTKDKSRRTFVLSPCSDSVIVWSTFQTSGRSFGGAIADGATAAGTSNMPRGDGDARWQRAAAPIDIATPPRKYCAARPRTPKCIRILWTCTMYAPWVRPLV
jgi:hypothetical protein